MKCDTWTRTTIMLMVGLTPLCVRAQTPLTTVRVASGLSRPVFVTHAPDDFERVFIVEQHTGRIKIMNLESGTINPAPFLDISGISTGNEQGLLGLAFHPDYADNGYFYLDFTASDRTTHVRRYTVSADPDIADPDTATTVLTIFQPQSNHNGGWIGFGPDGFLYVGSGDGGGGGDSGSGHTPGVGNGQDITNNLLGKMLRLDVDGDDFPADPVRNYAIPPGNPFVGVEGDDEIWAFGLRNPWRNSFDRETGDLWIADVGQNAWEELDFQPADSSGGENYGWRCREGAHDFNPTGDCSRIPFTEPIHEYSHGLGCSITGGYAYRGCAIPDLQGVYFFADYCSARIWSLRYDGVSVSDFQSRTAELVPDVGSINSISSFGEDAFGAIYICDLSGGEIFKIVPDVPGGIVGEDCNENQVDDACDILAGTSPDVNGNGIPDECECVGDLDGDGDTGLGDLAVLLAAYTTCAGDPGYSETADIDDSGCVDLVDLAILLADYPCTAP